MKKRIRDLTVEDIEKFCYVYSGDSYSWNSEKKCPLFRKQGCVGGDCGIHDLYAFAMFNKNHYLDHEIEVPEGYGKGVHE